MAGSGGLGLVMVDVDISVFLARGKRLLELAYTWEAGLTLATSSQKYRALGRRCGRLCPPAPNGTETLRRRNDTPGEGMPESAVLAAFSGV
jgi:hypothetical protein